MAPPVKGQLVKTLDEYRDDALGLMGLVLAIEEQAGHLPQIGTGEGWRITACDVLIEEAKRLSRGLYDGLDGLLVGKGKEQLLAELAGTGEGA